MEQKAIHAQIARENAQYERAHKEWEEEVARIDLKNAEREKKIRDSAEAELAPIKQFVEEMKKRRFGVNDAVAIDFAHQKIISTPGEKPALSARGEIKLSYPDAVVKQFGETECTFRPQNVGLSSKLDSANDDTEGYQPDPKADEPLYRDARHVVCNKREREVLDRLYEKWKRGGDKAFTPGEKILWEAFHAYFEEAEKAFGTSPEQIRKVKELHDEFAVDMEELVWARDGSAVKAYMKRKKNEAYRKENAEKFRVKEEKEARRRERQSYRRRRAGDGAFLKGLWTVVKVIFFPITLIVLLIKKIANSSHRSRSYTYRSHSAGNFFSAIGSGLASFFSAIGRGIASFFGFLVSHAVVFVIVIVGIAIIGGTVALSVYPSAHDKKKHMFDCGTVIAEATCTHTGTIEYKCVKHGDAKREKIPALHTYGADNVCTQCGKALSYSTGLTYEEDKEGVGYVITGFNVLEKNMVLPPYIEGKPVTEISVFERKFNGKPIEFDTLEIYLPDGYAPDVDFRTGNTEKRPHVKRVSVFGDSGWLQCWVGAVDEVYVVGNVRTLEITMEKTKTFVHLGYAEGFQSYADTELGCIALPKETKKINFSATYLYNIYVDPENENFTSVDGVLYTKDKSEILCYPGARKTRRYETDPATKIIDTKCFSLVKGKPLKKLTVNEGATVLKLKGNVKYVVLPASIERVEVTDDTNVLLALKKVKVSADFDKVLSAKNSAKKNGRLLRRWLKKNGVSTFTRKK